MVERFVAGGAACWICEAVNESVTLGASAHRRVTGPCLWPRLLRLFLSRMLACSAVEKGSRGAREARVVSA